jgi:hypothetical protein
VQGEIPERPPRSRLCDASFRTTRMATTGLPAVSNASDRRRRIHSPAFQPHRTRPTAAAFTHRPSSRTERVRPPPAFTTHDPGNRVAPATDPAPLRSPQTTEHDAVRCSIQNASALNADRALRERFTDAAASRSTDHACDQPISTPQNNRTRSGPSLSTSSAGTMLALLPVAADRA